MKIGEALAHLKKEKSRLARLISLRKENIYAERGKKTPFDPHLLSEQINEKTEYIRKLKICIQKTNLSILLPEYNISLAEAIVLIGEIRGKIAKLGDLFEDKSSYSYKLRSKDEIEKLAQLDESEVEAEMERLEGEKTKLDNMLQTLNWKTDVLESPYLPSGKNADSENM